MIDFAKKADQGVSTGIVCPQCFKPAPGALIFESQTDRYKRTTRRYFGWCTGCNFGFEIIQFSKDKTWHLHKYKPYRIVIIGKYNHYVSPGQWRVICELPEPAPIVTGPGGEYDKSVELNAGCFNALLMLQKTLQKTTRLVEQLLKAVK